MLGIVDGDLFALRSCGWKHAGEFCVEEPGEHGERHYLIIRTMWRVACAFPDVIVSRGLYLYSRSYPILYALECVRHSEDDRYANEYMPITSQRSINLNAG
jgi:hypothetical protein